MPAFEIDQEIIDKTTCEYEFACLKNNNTDFICKVDRCLDGICFLSSPKEQQCNNKIYYGDTVICNCPVRIEIYDKYGK